MQTATLSSDLPRNKRFHQPWWRGRVLLGLVFFVIAAGHTFWGKGPYHYIEGLFWTGVAFFYCAAGLTVWWELRPDGLFRRSFWTTQLIPYSDVTAVEQLDEFGQPIEVQYVSLSRSVFPRSKTNVTTSERQSFIDTLRTLAPQVEFRS